MSKVLLECKCGSREFIKTLAIRKGTITRLVLIDENGAVREEGISSDLEVIYEPARLRCDACGKTAPNPDAGVYYDNRRPWGDDTKKEDAP